MCGASYTYGDTDIFSLDSRSGMQIVWIGTSIVLGFILLMLDDRLYEYVAYLLYGLMIIALIATIFNPHEIKGSRSWLVLGPVHIQPAEFSKFVTALALAKLMSTYGFTLNKMKDFALAVGMLLLPMLCIVLQKETGSALVYLSFSLMLYREGMPGSILFTAVAMVIYFVVGIRFEEVMLWDTPTSVGKFSVLVMVQLFTAGMLYVYLRNKKQFWHIIAYTIGITILALLFSKYVIPFDIVWLQMALTAGMIGYLINLSDHILNNTLEPHQRTRINVLLGIDKDIKKTGYNVHQSQIAIGSGGITGKGFLNGTQTKLKFVPEQDTDFIFCTVGEEEGFVGCAVVLLLFLALILRLIKLSERQPFKFGRVYGYCVLGIFLFHVFINVGMVLGLTPVIGIPLPFFSYGGSSLWGFTLLLFIFLRIDAGRNLVRT